MTIQAVARVAAPVLGAGIGIGAVAATARDSGKFSPAPYQVGAVGIVAGIAAGAGAAALKGRSAIANPLQGFGVMLATTSLVTPLMTDQIRGA